VQKLFISIQRVSVVSYGKDPSPSLDATEDSAVAVSVEQAATLHDLSICSKTDYRTTIDNDLHIKDYIRMDTKSLSRNCAPRCSCQCHIPFQRATPRWLQGLIGVAFVNSVGTPLLNHRSCNLSSCGDNRFGCIHFSYLFPCRLLKFGIQLAASWNFVSGVGGTWTLRIPRIIDDGDMRIGLVSTMRLNSICGVQKFMAKYSIRPFDSFSWGSQSLFTVRISLRGPCREVD
jgi:hypothetical protein